MELKRIKSVEKKEIILINTNILKMSLETKIIADLKEAMKAKDKVSLRAIRAIKSSLMNLKTDGNNTEITEEMEIALLQKMKKSRIESLSIYEEQGRNELAATEKEEIAIIEKYLPEQMDEAALEKVVGEIIEKTGASSMKDMGKVMGMASKQLAGQADGKAISAAVKKLLG